MKREDVLRMWPYFTQIGAWKSPVLADKEQARQGSVHAKESRVWVEQ